MKAILFTLIAIAGLIQPAYSQRKMEYLNRGLVAVRTVENSVFLSWRLLGNEPVETGFNIYRKVAGGKLARLNQKPLTAGTNFLDSSAPKNQELSYFVRAIARGKEQAEDMVFKLAEGTSVKQYFSVPLQMPPGGSIDGKQYEYSANDASVGDLDGDGEYDIVLKWDPSNTKNPPQTGITANQIIDAYKMDGTRLWRIDLGKNIRSGAAYTQMLVADYDGDGKAEVVLKTADGTVDGRGHVIGDATKDWRTLSPKESSTYGKVIEGPEYLTVFDGATGAELASSEFMPTRYPLNGWGGIGGNGGNDNSGSRSDRFTAGVAYLDGLLPSIVFVRGWYGRTVIAAWDFRKGKLSSRWVFDTKDAKNPYSGMGNHSLVVADVDRDGKDEICVGAMTVDDNGKGLYTTGLRHGDAMHLTYMHPDEKDMQVFGVHESEERTIALQTPGAAIFNARTGKVRFGIGAGVDVGRGVAADIDPVNPGFENWGGPGGLRDIDGKTITDKTPSSTNFVLWWDGDLSRELLDKNRIDKWDWKKQETNNLLTAEGCIANNGTKATPALSADLFGDWREEVIWRTSDNKELRIYTSTIPTDYRIATLMHDPQYRLAIAWQNVSYNQPPHPGFYLGTGMKAQKRAAISIVEAPKKLVYSSDFSSLEPSEWVVEMAKFPNSAVYVKDNKLVLDTKGGATVWLNRELQGNYVIEYTRKVVVDSGKNDRLSDMNQFWMANDPANKNLFTRSGKFEDYDNLSLYYVGQGGNTNSTTRFRKYSPGNKPLIKEYKDAEHLLIANKEYKIRTIVKDGRTSYWVDGICYFDYEDKEPLKKGYFGFRSTWSRQEIKDLKIYRID